MNFLKRMKNEKGFRWKVFLVFIVIVLMYGNMDKKEMKKAWTDPAICNQVNTDTCYKPHTTSETFQCIDTTVLGGITQSNKEACTIQRGCYVGLTIDDELGTDLNYWDEYVCYSCAPPGIHVQNSDSCCSTKAESSKYKDEGYDYVCRDLQPNEQPEAPCTSLERQIGGLLDGVDFLGGQGCKTKFYIVAIGGGFVAMMLILSAI